MQARVHGTVCGQLAAVTPACLHVPTRTCSTALRNASTVRGARHHQHQCTAPAKPQPLSPDCAREKSVWSGSSTAGMCHATSCPHASTALATDAGSGTRTCGPGRCGRSSGRQQLWHCPHACTHACARGCASMHVPAAVATLTPVHTYCGPSIGARWSLMYSNSRSMGSAWACTTPKQTNEHPLQKHH